MTEEEIELNRKLKSMNFVEELKEKQRLIKKIFI